MFNGNLEELTIGNHSIDSVEVELFVCIVRPNDNQPYVIDTSLNISDAQI